MIEKIKKHSVFFLPYGIFLAIGAFLLLSFPNRDIFIYINSHYSSFWDVFFYYATSMGNGFFFVFISFTLLFFRFKHSLMAIFTYALSSAIVQAIKHTVMADALRPFAALRDSYTFHFTEGVDVHSYNSFPSGHAASAFGLFCLLTLINSNKIVGFAYFLLAFAAIYSRVYLAQHFFVDIYWGSIIGTGSALIVYNFCNLYFDKNPKDWYDKAFTIGQ